MHRRRVCRSKTKEILKLHVNLNIQKDVFWSTKSEDLGNYPYNVTYQVKLWNNHNILIKHMFFRFFTYNILWFENNYRSRATDILRLSSGNGTSENLCYHKISQIKPDFRYVDGTPTLV